MPEICRFYGIIITMYFNQAEHAPPHFHARYGDYRAEFDIRTLNLLRGNFPAKARLLVMEWAAMHSDELLEIWNSQNFKKIEPLEWGDSMYKFVLISSVQAKPDYTLYVEFENGEKRLYDVSPLFDKWPVFQQLKENNLFQKVKNDKYGVVWNEDIDLACDELYYNGQIVA